MADFVSGELSRLVIAVAAAWAIYYGYRLFNDVPLQFQTRRASVLVNMMSGVLLAMLGAGVLVAALRDSLAFSKPGYRDDYSTHRRIASPDRIRLYDRAV